MSNSQPNVSPPTEQQTVKHFVPLESNPDVMSSLMHKLGLSRKLAFHDVISVDSPELLSFIPGPAHALLLVFPTNKAYQSSRMQEDAEKSEYTGFGPEEEVVWYKQTIVNACGIIALLHAVSNGLARSYVEQDSDLSNLIRDAIPLDPKDRASLLYNSQVLENCQQHTSVGDTPAPSADSNVDLHFVCFVKSNKNQLWELDGRRKGPLCRGVLANDDVLSENALDMSVRRFLSMNKNFDGGDLRFSLIALAPALD